MRRQVGVMGGLLGIGMALAACASQYGSASSHRLASSLRGRPWLEPGDQWASECLVIAPGTDVVVTDISNGADLTLTTRSGDVQDLRRRALDFAAKYNESFAQPAAPRHIFRIDAPRITHGGGYGIGGGEGIKELEVPGRPSSRAVVKIISHGAKVVFSTDNKGEVQHVRTRAARQAVQLWAGTCPSTG